MIQGKPWTQRPMDCEGAPPWQSAVAKTVDIMIQGKALDPKADGLRGRTALAVRGREGRGHYGSRATPWLEAGGHISAELGGQFLLPVGVRPEAAEEEAQDFRLFLKD